MQGPTLLYPLCHRKLKKPNYPEMWVPICLPVLFSESKYLIFEGPFQEGRIRRGCEDVFHRHFYSGEPIEHLALAGTSKDLFVAHIRTTLWQQINFLP